MGTYLEDTRLRPVIGWGVGEAVQAAIPKKNPQYFSCGSGSEYEAGYLFGMEVTIPKGTPIHHRDKVKIHDVDQGSIMCLASSSWSGERSNPKRPTTPKICFAGSAGYWSEIDINDLVQENPLIRM